MNRLRVCVYAICKNEEKFVKRWYRSMSEADEIVVLDTGSTDGTVPLLRELGATVYCETIDPWRFDTARNHALAHVPEETDICVSTDLDEVFHPGWREKLEAAWQSGTQQASYRYTWNFDEHGTEGYVFWIDKIHARHNFTWKNPVHEVICYTGPGECRRVNAQGVQLDHYADPTKSRGQYLQLLELSIREDPENDRNMHYLGREYMYYGKWDQCIAILTRHLQMKSATWADERCASMRYIARAYLEKGEADAARIWLLRAIAEAPYLREPWLDAAMEAYLREDWYAVIYLTEQALKITERPRTYISEAASYGSLPYDLASLGYFYTGNYAAAAESIAQAVALAPDDDRLLRNQTLIYGKLDTENKSENEPQEKS